MRPCRHTPETAQDMCPVCRLCAHDERYRKLYDETDAHEPGWEGESGCGDCPAAPEPASTTAAEAEPGLIQKTRNFSAAYARWREAGKPRTPADALAERRLFCNRCLHRDPERDACRKCGCPLEEVGFLVSLATDAPGKLEMATEECPLPGREKRWRALAGPLAP